MDTPDRPPLDSLVYEQIEQKLHGIDKIWWRRLQMMSVHVSVLDQQLGWKTAGPQPPKQPLQLKRNLQDYATELFNEEASCYGVLLSQHWLSKLAERVEERILQRVAELNASFGPLTLSTFDLNYHGVTQLEMRQSIRERLKQLIEEKLLSQPQKQERIPTKRLPINESKEPLTPEPSEIDRRKALLAEYKAATGDPSDYQIFHAENAGLHKPEFYRWRNGTLPSHSKTATKFERFLRDKKPPIPRKPG